MATAENLICGECKFFDPNFKYEDRPVGTDSTRTGQPVAKGFCRAEGVVPNARWLGVVNADAQCRQPEPPPAAV
jgi:hypothetical protein